MAIEGYRSLDAVEAACSALGELSVYGASVQGRPLWVVDVGGSGPVVWVTAGLHGLEYIGVEVAIEVLRRGPLPGLRLRVCPVTNPDAYARTWEASGQGRIADLRTNARGVDLNRNFPLPWSARPSAWPFAGASEAGSATYRGPAPLSEPESRALVALALRDAPLASVNLHSFMGTLIAARVWHPSDWRTYRGLVRAFRAGGSSYRRLGSPVLDVFTGELEDWQHHVLRCWAVCVECFSLRESLAQHLLAPSSFARFNPSDPRPVAARDATAVRLLLEAAATLDRPPERSGAAATFPTWSGAGPSGDVPRGTAS